MANVSSWLAVVLNTIKIRKPGQVIGLVIVTLASAVIISVVAIGNCSDLVGELVQSGSGMACARGCGYVI